jgi:hypothetical protein
MSRKQLAHLFQPLILVATLLALVAMAFSACAPSNYTLSTSCNPDAGGSISPASGTYDKNVEVDVTASPASGYRFDHWEGSASGSSPAVHLVMDSNKHLTAYFTKTYTLSVSSTPTSGGSSSPSSGTYDEGAEVTLIATPAQYYRFNGWGGDASGSSDHITITMDSDKTIVASFIKLTYSLQAQADPSGSGTVEPNSGNFEAGTHVTVIATPASGFGFDHWGGSASGISGSVDVFMDMNKNLTAYFTRVYEIYTLSISCTPAIGGSVSPGSGTYDEGAEVTLIATPAQYYRFNGWGGDVSDSSDHITVTMDSNKNIVASFVKITYTLETQVDASGGGTVDPTSGTFEAGTQVTVTATPTSGYRFDHWGGSATGTSNPLNILVDTNKTVTAYFTKVYTLSVLCDPVGNGSVSPNSGVYDAGTTVTLTATTAVFPYAFDHWTGTDNDTANPTTVTMDSDKSVTAYFRQLSPGSEQNANQFLCGQTNWVTIHIQLQAGEWLQGQIKGLDYPVTAYIMDVSGTVVRDLGLISLINFTFQAQVSGTYDVIISNSTILHCNRMEFFYTIFS